MADEGRENETNSGIFIIVVGQLDRSHPFCAMRTLDEVPFQQMAFFVAFLSLSGI